MPEDHIYLKLASWHVPKLRFRAHLGKCKILLHCNGPFKRDDMKYFVGRGPMNEITEF